MASWWPCCDSFGRSLCHCSRRDIRAKGGSKMGARDVKRPHQSPNVMTSYQLGLSVVVLQYLLLASATHVNRLNPEGNFYWPSDLDALQDIWGEWNRSTPNLSSDLAGWNSTQPYPCASLVSPDATIPDWRGVYCLKTPLNSSVYGQVSQIDVITLSLSNASIVGTLSPSVGNLTYMTTLQLTGNPELTGSLPDTIGNLWLNILDVHDNGFSGPVPADLNNLWNLLQLDLSGNQFTGGYPRNQTAGMNYLQVLAIGRNNFAGEVPSDVFHNKSELQTLDLSDNNFTGSLPIITYMSQSLTYLDVSGNRFEGPLPDLTQFPELVSANLGGNNFVLRSKTPILEALWNLNATSTSLTTLNLSFNHLTGPLSYWNSQISLGFLQNLYLDNNMFSETLNVSKMLALGLLEERYGQNSTGSRLSIISLRNNNITNVVSDPVAIATTTTVFVLQGNPYCLSYNPNDDAQRCYCTQYCYTTPAKADNHEIIVIAATASVSAVVLILLVVVGAILYKNRRYQQYLQLEFKKRFHELDVKPTIFSYSELRAATRDFHPDMKLGQGGFGAVYKGVFPNGNVVAVKQLYIKTAQGMDEFLNEVVLITGMKHRNLVNLKGCCLREDQRLLVYEFVDNYDVDQILLEKESRLKEVSWPVRLKMCVGIARGLHYLHTLAQPRVIHRDIKASNVLLDKNLEPKIADFGLAQLFPDDTTHIMTIHVAGTKGYLAPEYASLGQLSDKVDVYSFGVLCLEIISGRKNIDETAPLDQIYLSQWAWQLHEEDRLLDLVDPTLQFSDEEERDLQRVIKMCLLCLQNAPEKRPTMTRILHILQTGTASDVQAVLDNVSKGERPSYESLMSQKSVNYTSSWPEKGMSSNGETLASQDSLSIGVMELGEIVLTR